MVLGRIASETISDISKGRDAQKGEDADGCRDKCDRNGCRNIIQRSISGYDQK